MRYTNFCLIACLITITSCSLSSNSANSQNALNTFDVDEAALERGLLLIHLPQETPKNLGIRTPTGEWFVLQESEESIEIMPQARFETLRTMKFKIETLKGVTWRESKKVTDLVFTTPGDYLVYFADNLETEPENTFSFQETIVFKK